MSNVDFFGGGGGRELNSKILYLSSQKEIEIFPSFSVVLFFLEAGVISIIFEKKRGSPEKFSDEEGRGGHHILQELSFKSQPPTP